jgi:hypothetical protein
MTKVLISGDTHFGSAFIMLGRLSEVQDEILHLMHDKDLKAVVASMKLESRQKIDDVVTIVQTLQSKDFWQTSKALLELSSPAMNILRLADSDIPAAGKVYHEMFKTEKLLESMLASADFNFIPKPVHKEIHAKWLKRWTDDHRSAQSFAWCRILPGS